MSKARPLHLTMAAMLYIIFGLFLIWPIAQVVRTGFVGHGGGFTLLEQRHRTASPPFQLSGCPFRSHITILRSDDLVSL